MSDAAPSDRPKRSLVVPMYREATRIAVTLEALRASAIASDGTELLFVDDGSDDGTAEVVERCAADLGLVVQVVRLERNRGKGAAVRAGALAARGQSVAFADADLSAGIGAILSVFEVVEGGQADVVVASRTHSGSQISTHQPPLRQFAGKAFNVAIRLLGLTALKDTQCGLKSFTAEAAASLFGRLSIEGFAFDVEILALAARTGLRMVEVPIRWEHVEPSRVSPTRDGLRMIRDALRVRFNLATELPAPTMPMGIETFDAMAKVERVHWWFRAKRRLVMDILEHDSGVKRYVLDIGCGTGAVLNDLGSVFKVTIGSDLDPHALDLACGAAPKSPVVRAKAETLPFRSGIFDAVTCLDVVEHLDDDVLALTEFRRLVSLGGLALIAVPAYAWAWSEHDEILGHRRRYTRRSAVRAIERAGWDVERATYFHAWLVPPALLLRRTPLRRLVKGAAEEASFVSPTVNRVLGWVTAAERAIVDHWDIPVGLSILVVARSTSDVDGGFSPTPEHKHRVPDLIDWFARTRYLARSLLYLLTPHQDSSSRSG